MQVASIGPLPVSSIVWQAASATWVLTVVCKATFTLAPVSSTLAPDQDPIEDRERHRDDDPAQSLAAASDLVPFKQSAEVLLVGRAYAAGGQPVRVVNARLLVGSVDKTIQVTADRAFTQQGELQEGARFVSMPLVYERAGGGPDTWNVAGIRRGARDRYGRVAVPNLTQPDQMVTGPEGYLDPVGFGPIAWSWPIRREKLGRQAATWSPRALAEGPLPDDIDRAFFNAAPPDQRLAEIRDNERIVLDGLHPDHAHLVTSLPGARPRAFVTGRAGGPQEMAMRCDTLVIDTDRLRVTATWRGQIALAHPQEAGRVLVALEQPGQAFPIEEMLRMRAGAVEASTLPIEEANAMQRSLLAPLKRPPPLPTRAPAQAPVARTPISESTMDLSAAIASGEVTAAPAMPFRAVPPAPPPPFSAPASSAGPPAFSTPGAAPPPSFSAPAFAPSTAIHDVPPPLVVPAAAAVSAVPVSPWAGAAAAPGATPTGTAAPVVAAVPQEAPQTIGVVLAASNAAAAVLATSPGAVPTPASAIAIAEEPAAETAQRGVLVLVWIDRKTVPRMVRKPAWRRLLDALDDEPIDPELDDPMLSDEPAELEERAQIARILDRAAAIDAEGARAAVRRSKLVPPLELLDGDLTLPFDEIETLKAMVSTTTTLADGDEALGRAIATAEKFLASPGVTSAPTVAEALTARIREAFAQGKRAVPVASIDAQVERALLEQRHYQRRKVLGGPRLRALLHTSGEKDPLVVYVPVAAAEDLPLMARFRARVIAAVQLAVDEREASPIALSAVAIGRVVELEG